MHLSKKSIKESEKEVIKSKLEKRMTYYFICL
jgi:hypothetical protein